MNRSFLGPWTKTPLLWLFVLSALLALYLGFVALSDTAAIGFVTKAGFWMVLVAFVLFFRALWETFHADLRAIRWRSIDWISVGVVALGGIVLLVHETFGFKIVMDEIMLLGTSMAMHFDKMVHTPVRGSDIQGVYQLLDGMMDKRPLFFPFLVSLVHDLTGYRPTNPFVVNGVLTFVFLGLVNILGRMLAGRVAGWLGVVLFAGLPLLAHNATGGGFELLNLVMIVATVLLGARFAGKRDEASLTAFCFSALLLAQVRYESVIYLGPVALLVLWVWWQERRVILSWPVVLAPLLMVHYPLQHRIFDLRASAWELGSKVGFEKPFALSYLPVNLQHAADYFFAKPTDQPNSLVLSVVGWLAVPFFVLLVGQRLRTLSRETPVAVSTTFFAFGFAAQFGLMMVYFWGQFDDVVIRRLSLPTHLGLVLAVLAILPQFTQAAVVRTLLALATVSLVASGVPSMAAHAYSQEYLPGRETAWRRQFIAEQPRHDYLMIDNDSILWVVHQISATPIIQAIKNRDKIVWNMRNRTYSDIFVFQRYEIDPATGAKKLRAGDDLGANFVLETVREERLQTLTLSRISRLKEVRDGGANLTARDPVLSPAPGDRTKIDKVRQAYLEKFMKMLP